MLIKRLFLSLIKLTWKYLFKEKKLIIIHTKLTNKINAGVSSTVIIEFFILIHAITVTEPITQKHMRYWYQITSDVNVSTRWLTQTLWFRRFTLWVKLGRWHHAGVTSRNVGRIALETFFNAQTFCLWVMSVRNSMQPDDIYCRK